MEAQLASCVAPAAQLERPRFARAWRALGARDDSVFELLAAAYAESHRAYHTAEHIAECLAWLDACHSLAERRDEVEIALTFHDAVYDPRSKDNELKSAELAAAALVDAKTSEVDPAAVRELILATRHDVAHPTGDPALICDIDLAIFGQKQRTFDQYDEAIRKEYAHVDEETYARERTRVLQAFLARPV